MSTKHPYSYTMDYETKEIVMTTVIDDQKIQLRACEKDIDSMKRWFDLARLMESDDTAFNNRKEGEINDTDTA